MANYDKPIQYFDLRLSAFGRRQYPKRLKMTMEHQFKEVKLSGLAQRPNSGDLTEVAHEPGDIPMSRSVS